MTDDGRLPGDPADDRHAPDRDAQGPATPDRDAQAPATQERLAEERIRELQRRLRATERTLELTERRLARVLAIPPVRLAWVLREVWMHRGPWVRATVARLRRGPGRVRREVVALVRRPWLRASVASEARFVERVRREAVEPGPGERPLVSIVMLNRDGEALLRRVMPALQATDYPSLELVVVDNGSSDGSVAYLEGLQAPFPIRIVRNAQNRSFSEANDQGAAAAHGELVLLLNNDIEPILPTWLSLMVETLLAGDATAVGARLIYPRHRGGRRAGEEFADLTLQHRGVGYILAEGVALPMVMGASEDPFSPVAAGVLETPALTAACFLIRRSTYDAAGGFSAGYDYGFEDVDLCLKLRAAGGRLVYDGRAVLWHHESSTLRRANQVAAQARRVANRARLLDAWGPRLFRQAFLDALDGSRQWVLEPLHVAIVPGPRAEAVFAGRLLAEGLRTLGWRVSLLEGAGGGRYRLHRSVQVLVSLDPDLDRHRLPPGLVTLAWPAAEPERWAGTSWLDDYDILLASSDAVRDAVAAGSSRVPAPFSPADAPDPARLREILRAWATATRFGIRIDTPSHRVAPTWGDTWFARLIQRELERAGHPARVEILPEWGLAFDARHDVTLHLFGKNDAPVRSGQVDVLWQISHPDRASAELYDRYDLAFVASRPFAERMARLARTPVRPLLQATDPDRFQPAEGGPAHQLLFVANSRGVRRKILDDLLPTPHRLAVYGKSWRPDMLDPRHLAGASIPNTDLNRYYSAAEIVLADHWPDMRDEGFIANRLFDALASGAFVISDDVAGLDAELDGAVETYRTAPELKALVDRWLADPDGRRALAERGRRAVLDRHTFAHRVGALLEAAAPLVAAKPDRVVLASPLATATRPAGTSATLPPGTPAGAP